MNYLIIIFLFSSLNLINDFELILPNIVKKLSIIGKNPFFNLSCKLDSFSFIENIISIILEKNSIFSIFNKTFSYTDWK